MNLPGEPDAGNLHVRFDEGDQGHPLVPTLLDELLSAPMQCPRAVAGRNSHPQIQQIERMSGYRYGLLISCIR